MLAIENLGMSFEGLHGQEVLKNINITAKDGEFVCILGPSGCGKTVFLHLIAGFLKPTAGRVTLDTTIVKKPGTDRVMIFQDYVLFPWMNVEQNIFFGLQKSTLSKKEKKDLVHTYLELVGLSKYKNYYLYALSGGMKQRVAIARALISNPKILLMDEPFAALDSQYRKYLRQTLEKLWFADPKTILFVTHSINEAVYLADTIYLFSNIPAEVKKTYSITLPRPRDPYSKEYVELVRNIEADSQSEFMKSLKNDPLVELSVEKILENTSLV
jgi:ABC-type nitrate/sulfonate/bicarbonate transport system ATPase subunit